MEPPRFCLPRREFLGPVQESLDLNRAFFDFKRPEALTGMRKDFEVNGIVKSYNDVKGYGFITPLVGKPGQVADVFFHISAVRAAKGQRPAAPPQGCEVRFDVVRGFKGPQAANVALVSLPARVVARESSRNVT